MQRFISLCLIIIIAATYVLSSSVYALAMLMLIGALLIMNTIVNFFLRKKIEVRCRVEGAVREKKADIDVHISNLSKIPIPFVCGRIIVENTYTGQLSERRFTVPLSPAGENRVAPGVEASSCGKYTLTIDIVSLKDVFGIIAIPVSAGGHCNFTVVPELFDTVVEYDLRENETFDNEMYSPYRKGQDRSEVYQIREYEEGDALNQIHWKLSSKLDKPVVKDASLPISKSMALVFDKSDPDSVAADVSEAMAEIMVSVGEYLIEEGLTFQLIWNDSEMKMVNTREIQFEEEFAEAIPQLLSGKIARSNESLAELHGMLLGSMSASHIIYVCPSERVIPEEVSAGGAVLKLTGDRPGYREEYREIRLGA